MTGRRQKKATGDVVGGDGGPAAVAALAHQAPPMEAWGNSASVTIAVLLLGLITKLWVSQTGPEQSFSRPQGELAVYYDDLPETKVPWPSFIISILVRIFYLLVPTAMAWKIFSDEKAVRATEAAWRASRKQTAAARAEMSAERERAAAAIKRIEATLVASKQETVAAREAAALEMGSAMEEMEVILTASRKEMEAAKAGMLATRERDAHEVALVMQEMEADLFASREKIAAAGVDRAKEKERMMKEVEAAKTSIWMAQAEREKTVIEAARRWVQEADAELSSPSRGVTAVVGAVVEEAKAAEREELAHIRRDSYEYCRVVDERLCFSAALNGDLAMLKWARENGCPWDENTCTVAAMMGHLELVNWARKNGCPWDENMY